uniref:NADH dehydrogenase subunit 6 n=1 Tax=Nothopsyche ruficollis TaxID=115141 RepID=UPI0022DCDE36|nr:NADH dehydrogenase subunit 6 [Nothopsyche ruficollis]UZZ44192.1 NADH dehydrogenase subunit 6 [Nothopsyche ruficollis]
MMKFITLFLMFLFTSLWLINLTHPMIITIFIILQTCILILITGIMGHSFWMSYIMFLTFIGGLLILFIYISSLTPNKIFLLDYKKMSIIFFTMIIFLFTMNIFLIFSTMEMTSFSNLTKFINNENKIYLTNFYNKNEQFITLILMNYLLLALIISTKITSINQGPLRTY